METRRGATLRTSEEADARRKALQAHMREQRRRESRKKDGRPRSDHGRSEGKARAGPKDPPKEASMSEKGGTALQKEKDETPDTDTRRCEQCDRVVKGGVAGWDQHVRSTPHLATQLWHDGGRSWSECRSEAKKRSKKLREEWDSEWAEKKSTADGGEKEEGKKKKQKKAEGSPVVDRTGDPKQGPGRDPPPPDGDAGGASAAC